MIYVLLFLLSSPCFAQSIDLGSTFWPYPALTIINGGTGATNSNGALNNLLPIQTGFVGQYLTTNGTSTSWAAVPLLVGDSGTGGSSGLAPAPSAGQAEQGNFLQASGSFSFVDTSKPRYPNFKLLSQNALPAGTIKAQSVAIYSYQNNVYALVCGGNGTDTITVYNVTNPASPQLRGYLTLAGSYGATVYFSAGIPWAIVPSSGGSRLYTVNLSNANSLSIGGNLLITGTPGSLYNAVASNGYVYISTQSQGLTVVDIGGGSGSLTNPIQVFQEGGSVKSFGVVVSGSTLYTTNYQTTFPATVRYLKTWSLSTPSTPSLQNTYTIPGGPVATSTKPGGISISGNTAIVTDINQLVYDVIDITTPTSPNYLSYITPSATLGAGDIAQFSGNYVYVSSGSNATYGGAIDFFDLTNRSYPLKIGTTTSGVANDVFGNIALYNGYIFAADYGVAPGSNGNLDIFAGTEELIAAGSVSTSNLKLVIQSSGQTPSCSSSNVGSLVLTSAYILCVCNTSSWVRSSDGSTACTF